MRSLSSLGLSLSEPEAGLLCVIGRRPKADNFGSIRGKREKDFWEEFQSLGVTNNTQEQEGKRTFSFSQLQVVKRGV